MRLADAIEEAFEPFAASIPGIVAGAVAGEETAVRSLGVSGTDRPLDPKTLFDTGSISKTFTGLLLAIAAHAGELRYDDPLRAHLPPGIAVPRDGDRDITLLDLATHSSGLPRLAPNLVARDLDPVDPYAGFREPDLYEGLGMIDAVTIGSEVVYSNFGFAVLGRALEHACAAPYEDLVRDRVCRTLGLPTTVAWRLGAPDGAAQGHGEGQPVPPWSEETPGDGGVWSSGDDMLRYLSALLDPHRTPLAGPLEDVQVPRVSETERTRYGLAWVIQRDPILRWHNGGSGGFGSFIGFVRDAGAGAFVLCNSHHDFALDRACGRLVLSLAG